MNVLYYYSQLNIGGAEKSTVRLLNAFVQKGHNVTLLLRWSGGALEKELDKGIRIIHLKKNSSNKIKKALENLKYYFRLNSLKTQEYDIVINGLFGYNPKILFNKLCAKQYYQLLRNDVEKTGAYGKTQQYMQTYGDRFSAYIGVSKYTTQSFINCYPQYKDRAFTIYNVLPEVPKEIGNIAQSIPENKDQFKIVTVCRLADKAKGLFRMVSVCKELAKEFNNFCWYIVGEGQDREQLKSRIAEANLTKTMVLCGETKNPFPYYKEADLVAVLSYHEGLCGVVNEAKMLEKPVIATKFSGIDEQIIDGKNGFIVENEEKAILEKLREILSNPNILLPLNNNGMPEELLNNDKKIIQFENLFSDIEKGGT